MNLFYIFPRLLRRFMPVTMVRFLLHRHIGICPGLETSSPLDALARYRRALDTVGIPIVGKRVMIFGYGGFFGLGCAFLDAGASHVTLVDRFASPDNVRNRDLFPVYADYLALEGDTIHPNGDFLTLWEGDIRKIAAQKSLAPFDVIVSNSVYEHLDDVDGITRALALLTTPDGVQLHFIDLRDHFFRYPFEMLTFSEAVWRRYLNPSSNLNRYRLPDYQRVFGRYFRDVQITVLTRDLKKFWRAQPRIRSEFLTGDLDIDAATFVQVIASAPLLPVRGHKKI